MSSFSDDDSPNFDSYHPSDASSNVASDSEDLSDFESNDQYDIAFNITRRPLLAIHPETFPIDVSPIRFRRNSF